MLLLARMGIRIGESENERNYSGVCLAITTMIIRFSSEKRITRINPVEFQGIIMAFTRFFIPIICVKNISYKQKFIENVELTNQLTN
jgi:hypothetical protein